MIISSTNFESNQESQVKDYFSLLKPRVMSLVVFTGFAGMFLAPGHINPFIGLIAILCIAIGSGAAGAINMWYEVDVDAKMERTKLRPIVTGKIDRNEALYFAVALSSFSVVIMGLAVNILSAFLLLVAINFYVFIYTIWLKRRTPLNIVIGGAAGAFPPMIGWASVTGNLSLTPYILFLIIFMWTPPHFWALSLYKAKDYQKANIPMLPVTHGEVHTKKQILIYSVLMMIVTLIPLFIHAGLLYGVASTLLGIRFIYYAYLVYYDNKYAPKMFGFSIIYLFLIFSFLMIDSIYNYIL